ncbi:MAG: hypothetical protein V1859_09125 [archaeon]
MTTLKELEKEIIAIKERNARVEKDKEWETSWQRKIAIAILTYVCMAIFFYFAKLPNPLVNSIVPAIAFVLSTLTLSILKKHWLVNSRK